MSAEGELFERAVQAYRAGRLREAADLLRQVLRIAPRNAQAWHQLGWIALALGDLAAAQKQISSAIRLDGRQSAYHNDLGECLRAQGQLVEAASSYRRALELFPGEVAAGINLAWTLRALGRTTEATACGDAALALPRRTAEEHCACATWQLAQGRMEEGWAAHEWRLELPGRDPRATRETRWDGSPLEGRTLLLYCEQGLGDTLQLVRYVPALRALGVRPLLVAPRSLLPLLREANLCQVLPSDEPWPRFDVQAALFSLPKLLGTTLSSVPNQIPYLQANAELTAEWGARLALEPGFRVGIHWQGNPSYRFDRLRSIPLAQFAPLARVEGVRLVSLQKNAGREQLANLPADFGVTDWVDDFDMAHGTLMDTAAVMKNLDLMITSDTVTAHLAGALGVLVWVPLSAMPEWRFLFDRTDSPWYPTMRLFRQSQLGDWPEVFARVTAELAGKIAKA